MLICLQPLTCQAADAARTMLVLVVEAIIHQDVLQPGFATGCKKQLYGSNIGST